MEERDKQISAKQSEEVVFAPGQSIESSLKQYAERRSDIFGVGDEGAQETMIGKKIGEEETRPGMVTAPLLSISSLLTAQGCILKREIRTRHSKVLF